MLAHGGVESADPAAPLLRRPRRSACEAAQMQGDHTAPAEPLPSFRYHPDPVASRSIEPSDAVCEACNLARGWRYVGSVYGPQDVEHVCPWCIADGTAAELLDAE